MLWARLFGEMVKLVFKHLDTIGLGGERVVQMGERKRNWKGCPCWCLRPLFIQYHHCTFCLNKKEASVRGEGDGLDVEIRSLH